MLTFPEHNHGRDLDAEREDLYDRLTRGLAVALDVYADEARRRRRAEPDFDLPVGPPGSIEIDAALGLAVEMLRGAGDEPLAWLIVEAMALRGGPPARVMEAIVALHTLHQGPPPALVDTARKAARGGGAGLPRPTIVPMRPWSGPGFDRGRR